MYRMIFTAVASFAATLAATLATPAGAQAAPPGDSTLARLTREAVAANPSLIASQSLARAADARVRPAGALPDPMVSAGVMDLTLPGFAFNQSDFTELDLELSQEFPWPGTLGARTASSRAAASALEADVAVRRREVVVHTAELYYRLRYVVTARGTIARQRALLAAAVDISTARYASTAAPQSDPLQARVSLARLDTEAAELAATEAELRAQLKALRNVAVKDSVTVEPIRPELVATSNAMRSTSNESLDNGAADTLPDHPRLSARRAELEAAERDVRVARLAARPDFTFTLRYGYRPTVLGFDFPDFFSAFVGVRLPIFAGRKQFRLADAARAETDAARAGLAEEQAALTEEIRTVRAQLESEATRLELLTRQVVPSAQATVDATLRGYQVGQVQFVTVLATEDALYRAQLDAARVAAEHLTHLVVLEQLVTPEGGV